MADNRVCEVNQKYLQRNGYQLIIPKFPYTEFHATNFNFPAVMLPTVPIENPLLRLPMAGEKMVYEPMTINFIVDEQMKNYKEIHKWMSSISFDTSNSKYTNYEGRTEFQILGEQDIKVAILSAKGNPLEYITFFDAVPTMLSGFEMTQQDTTTEYVMASVSFEFTSFEFDNPA
jgi:hypothetical protein